MYIAKRLVYYFQTDSKLLTSSMYLSVGLPPREDTGSLQVANTSKYATQSLWSKSLHGTQIQAFTDCLFSSLLSDMLILELPTLSPAHEFMNSELPKPFQMSDPISLIYLSSEVSQWMNYIKWLWLYEGVAILSWPQRFESQGLYTRSRKVGDNKMPEGWLDGLLYSYCVVLGYKLLKWNSKCESSKI